MRQLDAGRFTPLAAVAGALTLACGGCDRSPAGSEPAGQKADPPAPTELTAPAPVGSGPTQSDPGTTDTVAPPRVYVVPNRGAAGLRIEDLKTGTGPEVGPGWWVGVHYTARVGGREVDSSRQPGRGPDYFMLPGNVMEGWSLGIPGMRVGGTRRLTIPPEFGLGAEPKAGIPGNSTLVCEFELIQAGRGGDFSLQNGFSITTRVEGEGSAADIGSFVRFHVVVYGDRDERVLYDTHAPGRSALEWALPGPPGVMANYAPTPALPWLNTCLIDIRPGEFRRAVVPREMAFGGKGDILLSLYQQEGLIYEIDCLEVRTESPWSFSSGVQVHRLEPGDGPFLAFGHYITYHYRVADDKGTEYISTFGGEPLVTLMPTRRPPFVEGLVTGLQGMRAGETRRIRIPAALIYRGAAPVETGLPAGKELIYEVRLIDTGPLPPQ